MASKIIWSPASIFDLREIVTFIAEDNAESARRVGGKIIKVTRQIERFPKTGRVVPEFGDESIREIIVYSYRIVYRLSPGSQSVEVIRIWHAARGVPELWSSDRPEQTIRINAPGFARDA